MPLRPYQTELYNNVRLAFSRYRSVLMQLPTGGGKTNIFAAMTHAAEIRGRKIWIIVPRNELLRQASEKLSDVGVKHGRIAAGFKESKAFNVHVVSKDTLIRRLGKIKTPPDFIIIDEAHLALDRYIDITSHFPEAKILGTTATPERLDGRGLSELYQALVSGPSLQNLIEAGYLSRFRYYAPPIEGLAEVKRNGTEYEIEGLENLLRTRQIYGRAIDHYRRLANGRPAIVYCRSVAGADETAQRFNAAGYRFENIDGTMSYKRRKSLIAGLRDGHIQGLTSCDLITYGLDVPRVKAIIMLRPTMSRALYCLDDKTEILTDRRWLKISDPIEYTEKAAAFDPDNGSIHWSNIISVIRRRICEDEKIFGINTSSIDIRVTDNHNIIIGKRNRFKRLLTNWKFEKASSPRLTEFKIPICGIERIENPAPLSDDDIRFIGLVMTDGSIGKTNKCISIGQSERYRKNINYIQRVLYRCNFKYGHFVRKDPTNYGPRKYPMHYYTISYGKPRGTHKDKTGWSRLEGWIDKDFSNRLNQLDCRQFAILVEAMEIGDGSKHEPKEYTRRTRMICTASRLVANRMQSLAVRRGWKCNVTKANDNGVLMIRLRDGKLSHTIKSHSPDMRPTWGEREFHPWERVWCIQVDTGAVITRRNGKVSILGNCQMVGRGLRPDGVEAIILDHVGNLQEHGHPLAPYEWQFDGRERRRRSKDQDAAALRLCPELDYMYCDRPSCVGCPHNLRGDRDRKIEEIEASLIEAPAPVTLRDRPPDERREYQDRELEAVERFRDAEAAGVLESGPVGTLLELAEDLGRSPMWVYWRLAEGRRTVNVPLIHEIARQKGYKPGWAYFKKRMIVERLSRGQIGAA